MKVEINRREDTASITGISIKEMAAIMTAVERCRSLDKETTILYEKFKIIVEEAGKKNGIS